MTPIIVLHAACALVAMLLGLRLLLRRKGTPWHVRIGWVYIALLVVVSVSGIFIQRIRPGQFSLIHLLIPFTLLSLVYALVAISKYKQTGNRVYRGPISGQ